MNRPSAPRLLLSLSMVLGIAALAAPAQAGSAGNGSAGSGVAGLQNGAGLQQFRYEADAHAHCPADVVVWGSSANRGVFYVDGAGPRRVGGYYACMAEARKAGYQIVTS